MNFKDVSTGLVIGAILAIAGTFFIFQERVTKLEAKSTSVTDSTVSKTSSINNGQLNTSPSPKGLTGDKDCKILTQGNKYYSTAEYEKALSAYSKIKEIDKVGKGRCTGAIYATMATIYTSMANSEENSNPNKAFELYMKASSYNRAFAHAVDCNLRSCTDAEKFWAKNIGL